MFTRGLATRSWHMTMLPWGLVRTTCICVACVHIDIQVGEVSFTCIPIWEAVVRIRARYVHHKLGLRDRLTDWYATAVSVQIIGRISSCDQRSKAVHMMEHVLIILVLCPNDLATVCSSTCIFIVLNALVIFCIKKMHIVQYGVTIFS